jgi:hypothetical protein
MSDTRMRALYLWLAAPWIVILAIILLAAILTACPARAHEAYDYRCCGERDCAPVADSAVHETADAVVFRIAPGAHPMWPADKAAHLVVEIDRFRLEQRRLDGRWHICLNTALHVLCAYPPERGF